MMSSKIRTLGPQTGRRTDASTTGVRRRRARRPGVEVLERRALMAALQISSNAALQATLSTPNNLASPSQTAEIDDLSLGGSGQEQDLVSILPNGGHEAELYLGNNSGTIFGGPSFFHQLSMFFASHVIVGAPPGGVSGTAALNGGSVYISPGGGFNIGDPIYVEIDVYNAPSVTYGTGASFSGTTAVEDASGDSLFSFIATLTGNTGTSASEVLEFHVGDTFNITFAGSFTSDGQTNAADEMGADINIVPPPSPPDIVLNPLSWDPKQGGVDYGYQVSEGPLPNGSSVDFYWASGPSEADELGGPVFTSPVSGVSTGTYGMYNVSPSNLGTPPTGATYLLAVAHAGAVNAQTDSVMSLPYDPEVTITAKYDGSSDPDTIGRFLAIPGLLTGETFDTTLSDSLAALRPQVDELVGSQILLTQPVLDSSGDWDGKTYAAPFDPGTLSGPTPMTALAKIGDQPLADDQVNLDVQPVPDWILALKDSDKPTFTPDTIDNGGTYTFKGFLVDLGVPNGTAIPKNIQFVGGSTFGANVGFGVQIVAPLDTAVAPTATGYLGVKLTFNNSTLFEQDFQPSTSYKYKYPNGNVLSGTLTAALSPTLDPETLEDPDGGVAVTLNLSATASIPNIELYQDFSFFPEALLEAQYTVSADLNFKLGAKAQIEYTPGVGFTLVGGGATSLSDSISATLKGEVDLGWFVPNSGFFQSILRLLDLRDPALFPSANQLPALEWKNTLSGTLAVHALVNYSGDSDSPSPVVTSFGGSLNAALQTQLVFTIGNTIIVGTPPFDVLPYLFPNLPVKWGN